jgi:HSP20 family molecular chaperone IbpA
MALHWLRILLTAAPIASSSNIDFDFIPDANDYGTQTISFSAYDGTYYTNDTIDITFTIDGVYDDPISLNEGSSTISVSWSENQVGTLHDFNPTDADSTANNNNRVDNNSSSTEGARIYYEISGNDEEFFEISNTGVLTFKSAPNYESPTDETGYPTANNLEGDNEYNIVVEVRDTSDPNDLNVNTDSVSVNVTVTNVNELPTLSEPLSESDYQHKIYVTEDTTWVWEKRCFFHF